MTVKKISLALVMVCFLGGVTFAEEAATEESLSWFAVQITVGPGWDESIAPNEQAYFKEHSMHLAALRKAGHIVLGARYSDIGLLVLKARSLDEVRALMDEDPSIKAGTFQYEVHPMNVFYPGIVGDPK